MAGDGPAETVHATCVADRGRGLLILGPSGSGKSALALDLLALGAGLIADDQVILTPRSGRLVASCPPRLSGLIEARGLGLLNARPAGPAPVVLALDLGRRETERLPPRREVTFGTISIPLIHRPMSGHVAAAILHYVRCGRSA